MKFIKGMNLLKLDIQHFATSSAMSTKNQYIKYSITVTENSQNILANPPTTNVTVTVKVWRTNSGYTSYDSEGTCYCKINGTTYSQAIKSSQKVTQNSNTVFFTKTLDIPHNADGTKTLTCSAWFSGSDVFSSSEQSYSQVLTKIPRASVLGTISDFTLGNSITIPFTSYSSSFTHELGIYLNGTLIKYFTGVTDDVTYSFTSSELETIYKLLPNTDNGTFTIALDTFSGGEKIGGSNGTAKGTIPSSVKPTISNVVIAEANTDVVPSSWGVYIKNKSKLKFTTTATAGTGSSISSIKTTVNGATYTGSPITTNVINESGSLTATITATDTRGRPNSTTKTINVLDYAEPYIDTFSVVRCDANGNPNDSGTYAKVNLKGGIYSLNGKNTPTYEIKYKKSTDDEYQTHSFNVTTATIDKTVILSNISTDNVYNFRATIGDYFTSNDPTKKETTLASQFVLVDYLNGGRGIAFGKVAEKEGVMDINLNIQDKYGTNIGNGLATYDYENLIDADTTIEHLILTDVNTPMGQYNLMYVQTFFYHEKTATAHRTQIAVPYNSDGSIYYRYYFNGTWSEWIRFVKEDELQEIENKITNAASKSAIMVALNASKTFSSCTAWGWYHLPYDRVVSKTGSKLSLSSDGRVLYTGDKVLKVTIQVYRNSGTTAGNIYPFFNNLSEFQGAASSAVPIAHMFSFIIGAKDIKVWLAPSTAGKMVLEGHATNNYNYLIVEEV